MSKELSDRLRTEYRGAVINFDSLMEAADTIEQQAAEIERLREKNRMPAHELDGAPQDEKLCRHCMDTGTCANGAVCKDCTAAWKKATERNTMEWVPRHRPSERTDCDAAASAMPVVPEGWIKDPDSIPQSVVKACRDAICKEFGNNGTDGYYKRILAKVFQAIAAAPKEPT